MDKWTPNTITERSIEICFVCKGTGQTSEEVITDYHRREYDVVYKDCERCKGTGRLKKLVTTEYTPYER